MKRLTFENAIHAAIVIIAVMLRFYALGDAPLSDLEATWALQARNISLGAPVNIGPQPAYVFLTGFLFYLFDDTNFLARFFPALMGGLMVASAYLLRNRLGRLPALVLAFGLAIDPGLVAVSRIAGGPILALAFPVLAAAALSAGMPVFGGLLLGVSLLAGPSTWGLVLALVLTLFVLQLLSRSIFDEHKVDVREMMRALNPGRNGLYALILSFAMLGTGYAFFPQGLGAFANSIPAYFTGWFASTGVPITRMVAAYILYNPFALIFAITGVILAWNSGRDVYKAITVWWLVSFVLVILYPSRQVPDLIFLLLPTWILAGLGATLLLRKGSHVLISLGQAALLSVFGIMLYLTFASFSSLNLNAISLQSWSYLLAIAVLGLATTGLIGMGWTWQDAALGFGWGIASLMVTALVATTFRTGFLNHNEASELWYPSPVVANTDILMETIWEFGEMQTGRADTLDMAVFFDVPSLRWALKDLHNVEFFARPRTLSEKDAIITLARDETIVQEELYRGQGFIWWSSPGWERGITPDWWRWLNFREAPLETEEIILWVKTDIFTSTEGQ